MNHIIGLLVMIPAIIMAETVIEQHYLHLDLDPSSHILNGRDQFQAKTDNGKWEFLLSSNLTISKIAIGGKDRSFSQFSGEDAGISGLVKYSVKKAFLESSSKLLDISYHGSLQQDAGEASFSRERIAMEVNATITEEGIFLSPSGGYYPVASESLTKFDTKVKLPAGWDAVSEGDIVSVDKNDLYSEIRFTTSHQVDGIFITAAEWVVYKETVDDVDFYTYFFAEDTSLAKDYMRMSIDYVKLYADMLSPYPFSKFAVVENFFPTGYGMPSYTVLGRSVVNLPFIVYTSLGHEVLHNWWGNSVFVGEGGNWCEGLTVYQADYLYKLQKGEGDARQYRKDTLKDYTVYVNEENDFSPSEFVSRTDMASRTIGYGKVAMVFHMIEEHIGHDSFITALKDVISDFTFKHAGFHDFILAFEQSSGKDLRSFEQAWINKDGNPQLQLEVLDSSILLHQLGEVKPMWVPVRYTYLNGAVSDVVYFSKEQTVMLPVDAFSQLSRVEVDPDFHIMRKLHDSEMDATIRHMLSEEQFVFVVPEETDEWLDLANNFNAYISDGADMPILTPDFSDVDSPVIYLGHLPNALSMMQQNGDLFVYGDTYESDTHAAVWAFKGSNGKPALAIYSTNPRELIPLARKIPHYGKYGYLVFEHGTNVKKGNHESSDSPLQWVNSSR